MVEFVRYLLFKLRITEESVLATKYPFIVAESEITLACKVSLVLGLIWGLYCPKQHIGMSNINISAFIFFIF